MIQLSSHGYTLVAKGVEKFDRGRLQHENQVYDRLRSIQGIHIPVCLGTVDLDLPYYYDCGVYVCLLFLGWAGQPVFECINQDNREHIRSKAAKAFTALHKSYVLHRDAELRNMLYDKQKDCLMIVDFERAEFRALQSIDLNQTNRKRKRTGSKQEGDGRDDFEEELQSVIGCVSRCIRR
jgi:tRNA A-37 threonylcarbamoyl transferase component Bud32